jgi:pimeloyl-ACP methyl ester carboxylesterase
VTVRVAIETLANGRSVPEDPLAEGPNGQCPGAEHSGAEHSGAEHSGADGGLGDVRPADGVEMLEVDANGFRFTVRTAGPADGTPVVLLHGFPQTSWAFRASLTLLAEAGHRAVAPDQRGYAARARPSGVDAYELPQLVSDVLALAETLELGPFHLVGHDWGGIVAWLLAARHLDRVRTLTVVSTPCPPLLRAQLGQEPGTDPATRSRYLEMFRSPGDPELALVGPDGAGAGLRAMFAASGLRSAAAQEYVDAMVRPGAITAALNWFRALRADHVSGLPPVVVPTLAVWSSRDVVLSRSAAEGVRDFAAGRFRFEVLDGVTHWVLDEAPERLGALLLEHFAGY